MRLFDAVVTDGWIASRSMVEVEKLQSSAMCLNDDKNVLL
jgi:hypothetical protein